MIYDKLPVLFLSAVSSEKEGSTNSAIASYILEHLDEVQSLGIREIARRCNVGTASLSRFCREIGLSDFAQLRELLTTNQLHFEKTVSARTYTDTVEDRIRMTEESIDFEQLQALCRDIRQYPKIAAFGLLKAGTASLNLQVDLMMLGKQIYTNVSYAQQLQYLSKADEKTLILIFSYTGSYFDYPETHLSWQKNKEPHIWMISGEKRNYPPYVKRALHFHSAHDQTGHPYQLLFVSSLIAQEYARLYQKDGAQA